MKVSEFHHPRDHLVIDDFLSSKDLAQIWRETLAVGAKMKIGLQSKDSPYREIKNNRNILLYPNSRIGGRNNQTCRILRENLNAKELVERFEKARSPIYRFLRHCNLPHAHISAYQDGQYYGRHVDTNEPSNLTILFFLCKEPKRFLGGDFIIEFDGKQELIEYRSNRLVIFPSNTPHQVTPVQLKDGDFDDGRFSIQIWPSIRNGVAYKNSYRAKDNSAYYVPRFALSRQQWATLRKVAASSSTSEKTGPISSVVRQLMSNLKYIGRGAFPDHSIAMEILTRSELGSKDELFRVLGSFRHNGTKVSFGYSVARSNTKPVLYLFWKTDLGVQFPVEDACVISPQADFKTTMSAVMQLLRNKSTDREDLLRSCSEFANAA